MLTATYTLQSSIEVPAPKPKEKGAQQQIQTLDDLEINNIIVRIDANNKITVDNQEVEAKRLVHHIREILYDTKKNELVIQAANSAIMTPWCASWTPPTKSACRRSASPTSPSPPRSQ